MNFKEIHIGHLIEKRVEESDIEMSRICDFLKCSEAEIQEMYKKASIDTFYLLRWSKLLAYDFFRIYTQHIILYSPLDTLEATKKGTSVLPNFRKNIYTQEIIDFILEQINSDQMTIKQVIDRYNIPKATLYRWLKKHSK